MRQSVGMNAQLNIIIVFILIVFALLAASLSYYKAYKASNAIASSIEKYEGHNKLAQTEIQTKLKNLSYNIHGADCDDVTAGDNGYCIQYMPTTKDDKTISYSYKITTYMTLDLPLVNLLRIPITSYTDTIYCINDNCD